MERVHGAGAIDRHEGIDASLSRLEGFLDGRRVLVQLGQVEAVRQVVVDRVGQDEVAVRQTLHERRGTQAVRAVVGEVCLAGHV